MIRNIILLALAFAATLNAAPASHPADIKILQFALSLEHIENALYQQALNKFDDQAFQHAGFPSWVRLRFEQLTVHEKEHARYLQEVLGDDAPQPCEYDFSFRLKDPSSFVQAAMVFESIAGSSYITMGSLLNKPSDIVLAGSIGLVEARHAAWISSAALHLEPWSKGFETPLGLTGAYTLAQPLIARCPWANFPVPPGVQPDLPALKLNTSNPIPGGHVRVTLGDKDFSIEDAHAYLAWFNGLTLELTKIGVDGTAPVPNGIQGIAYVAIVINPQDPFGKQLNIVSGFSVAEFKFLSLADNS